VWAFFEGRETWGWWQNRTPASSLFKSLVGHRDLWTTCAGLRAAQERGVDKCNRGSVGLGDRTFGAKHEDTGGSLSLFAWNSIGPYFWAGVGALAMVGWGLLERRRERINLESPGLRSRSSFSIFRMSWISWPLGKPDRLGVLFLFRRMGAGAHAAAIGRPSRGKEINESISERNHSRGAAKLAIVVSLGAKYAIDRGRFPRVWAQTAAYDPDLPIRGRYLSVRVRVDQTESTRVRNCPRATWPIFGATNERLLWRRWRTSGGISCSYPTGVSRDTMEDAQRRHSGSLTEPVDFFLPEHAIDPSRRKQGKNCGSK